MGDDGLLGSSGDHRRHAGRGERGQVLVIVALLLTVIGGLMGLVIDIGWYQVNLMRLQRAADAAALAGVVYLPGNPTSADSAARAEAAKNGYTDGVAGASVTPQQDPVNRRQLVVDVAAPVPIFFSRLFGLYSFAASRRARAEFILPVPMGSPQDYYGIYVLCDSSDATLADCSPVGRAPDVTTNPLASQGFWGAVITKGGQRSNGDAYSTFFNGGANPNADYDPLGYSYGIELPFGTANGQVWLFDPTFCAVGRGVSGSYLGTGDHWIGTGGRPVTTDFRLWDTMNTPYATVDDTLIAQSGFLFTNQNQVDKGPRFKGNARYSDGGYNGSASADCQTDPNHNRWYQLAMNLPGGTYRLQVTTSSGGNDTTNAENMWGIQVLGDAAGSARVYGQSRMAAYANLNGAAAVFYLAQIDAIHAGKTVEVRLFDPGDVGGNASLRIKMPGATGYSYATFNFTANGGSGGQSGTNVSSIVTASGGGSLYQNAWLTISVPLPATYGQGGLTPPGEAEPGWWKIEYNISAAGNDTTTWEVNIRGNPVHLVVP